MNRSGLALFNTTQFAKAIPVTMSAAQLLEHMKSGATLITFKGSKRSRLLMPDDTVLIVQAANVRTLIKKGLIRSNFWMSWTEYEVIE